MYTILIYDKLFVTLWTMFYWKILYPMFMYQWGIDQYEWVNERINELIN
jgi:hypothetical protein